MGSSLTNNITAALNLIAFLCSIPIISSSIWLSSKQSTNCIHITIIHWPPLLLGIFVLLVSLMGFIGAHWNKPSLLALYLVFMALLILLLLVLLVFVFVVTGPDGGFNVAGRRYKEYRIEGFSLWLREHVVNSENWVRIKGCLAAGSHVCGKLSEEYVAADQFFMANLSPVESGCCKPPTACGYNYVNPTMWTNRENSVLGDPDCYIWSNDQSQLCYNCNSCKAALLENLRKEWRKTNLILVVALVVLIWVYIIACSAFKNSKKSK